MDSVGILKNREANNLPPFSFFDRIVVLNLKERTDRRVQVEQELKRVGINEVKFFEGFSGGHKGFNKSMFEILKANQDVERLLVLEDDCYFTSNGLLSASLRQMPYTWDILSFGANLRSNHLKVKTNLVSLKDGWMSHAIGYSNKIIRWIIANYDQDLVYDEWLRIVVYPRFECYMTYPIVAWQRQSYSDLIQGQANYSQILIETNKMII